MSLIPKPFDKIPKNKNNAKTLKNTMNAPFCGCSDLIPKINIQITNPNQLNSAYHSKLISPMYIPSHSRKDDLS
jgi:hypothetical protein